MNAIIIYLQLVLQTPCGYPPQEMMDLVILIVRNLQIAQSHPRALCFQTHLTACIEELLAYGRLSPSLLLPFASFAPRYRSLASPPATLLLPHRRRAGGAMRACCLRQQWINVLRPRCAVLLFALMERAEWHVRRCVLRDRRTGAAPNPAVSQDCEFAIPAVTGTGDTGSVRR